MRSRVSVSECHDAIMGRIIILQYEIHNVDL